MLVKLLTAMASMTESMTVGDIVDLPEDTVHRLIATGQGELPPASAPVPPESPAVEKKKPAKVTG
jgi:hypothetical protein